MPNARTKRCANCAQLNRATARYCTACGYTFASAKADNSPRKRCVYCGFYNRLGAKVCSQCGRAFHVVQVARGGLQKWCPQCGAPRRRGAKVCSRCGYRFRRPPLEAPVVQSGNLADPITQSSVAPPTPAAPPAPRRKSPDDLSGVPAPYVSGEELKRLRRMGDNHRDVFVRLFSPFQDEQP